MCPKIHTGIGLLKKSTVSFNLHVHKIQIINWTAILNSSLSCFNNIPLDISSLFVHNSEDIPTFQWFFLNYCFQLSKPPCVFFSVPGLTMSLPLFSHCPELVFVTYLLVIPGLFRFVLIISITVVPVTIKHFKMYIMLQPDIKNNLHQQFHHHSKVYKFQTWIVYIEFKNNSVFSNW